MSSTACCGNPVDFATTATTKTFSHRKSFARPGSTQGVFAARKADMAYLRILKQAALGLETDVTQALTLLLARKTNWMIPP